MFKNFDLTFPPECVDVVKEAYNKANIILEYGSGGSTFLAAESGKTIISVESSCEWMMELVSSLGEKKLLNKVMPLWIDIGPTRAWGHPANSSKKENWQLYSRKPWQYCQNKDIHPDTVLIDGRFRVSCFLASCYYTKKPITILFDDFVDREKYHVVKELFEPAETYDRLAVFHVKPNMIDHDFLSKNKHYFYNPD